MQAKKNGQFPLNEHGVIRIHDYLYSRHKYFNVFMILSIYMAIILLWGEFFEVSANYFILLPLIVVAISFGFRGGLIAGFLGLPANLFFFYVIGHLEYAPASLFMAEMSGILVGSILGYLSDFFTKMKNEMRQRQQSERALEKSLREKELLLKEINHRVKNNLNLIKSLVQLQTNRAESAETKETLKKLRDRIIAIATVQDLLYSQDSLENLDLNAYIKELLNHMLEGFQGTGLELILSLPEKPVLLEGRKITSLGIIINEIITNITKYGISGKDRPLLEVSLETAGGFIRLGFRDNGPGYPENQEHSGLGFKLIRALLEGLQGRMELRNNGGGELIIHLPAENVI